MELTLTDEERDLLTRLVRQAIEDTRVEIVRTDNQTWRDELHARERLLKSLCERIESLRAKEPALTH